MLASSPLMTGADAAEPPNELRMKDITLAAQRARGHIQYSNKSIDAVIGAAGVGSVALVAGLHFWTCLRGCAIG
jgi:hypothetical protein